MKQKVLVMGASLNPERYSYMATNMLLDYGHEVMAFGLREGEIRNVWIHKELPKDPEVDTVTLYLGPANQTAYYDYILELNPKRVIFNPGTENPEFEERLKAKGIEPLRACTLVMLRTNQFGLAA